MSRQDANAAFALSSFLQGTNATYIDEIYARYENDPSSVDSEWQEFFKSLKDTPADVRKNAEGPSWARSNWPVTPQDDLTSALDGNWVEVEKVVGKKLAAKAQDAGSELASTDVHQATRDSVRALMLIRAYRMRGHFHAKLDPLGIEAPRDREELDPRSYGFTEADFDRKIFFDHVLGLKYAPVAESVGTSRATQLWDAVVRQAASRSVPRIQGRLGQSRRRRRLRRRQISPRRVIGPRVRQQQDPPVVDRQPVASGNRRSGGARQGADRKSV